MTREHLASGRVTLFAGDCLDVLAGMAENSVDAVVTDPPYHLTSNAVAWDTMPLNRGKPLITKKSVGFMGKAWDGGDVAFRPETWAAVMRVLRPGGHMLACGGTRTYHRMVCAIEDAGMEVRDCILWVYSQGFPKSHDVSKGIDRNVSAGRIGWFGEWLRAERERRGISQKDLAERGKFFKNVNHGGLVANWELGYGIPTAAEFNRVCDILQLPFQRIEEAEREVIGKRNVNAGVAFSSVGPTELEVTAPATDAAREWDGWGTALKPAVELICLARKPLSEKTVAANVLRWGCGGLNIDQTRINPSSRDDDVHAYEQLYLLCASLGRGDASLELALDVARCISFALQPYSNSDTALQHNVADPSGIGLVVDQAGQRLLSRLVPNVPLCDLNWLEALNSQAYCQSCRHFCDGHIHHVQAAALESSASLRDVLADICRDLHVHKCNRVSRDSDHPSNLGACHLAQSFASSLLRFILKSASYLAPRQGRWPANLIHDGSAEVLAAFPETTSGTYSGHRNEPKTGAVYGKFALADERGHVGDSGSAARFFYSSKADADDRLGSKHPTVKPVDLIQYLARLITPPSGVILDPFAGTGTLGEAALREGFRAVLIEREAAYCDDIRRRMQLATAGPVERRHESIKARGKVDHDAGPLFAQVEAIA